MAERLGISPRRFDGWEPEQVTTYEYDDAGRLVRAVVTREPEWDEHNQALMLALAEYRAGLCEQCGGDLAETTDPANEGRYVPLAAIRCHRCDGIQRSGEVYKDAARPGALLHRVMLHPPRVHTS